MEENQENLDSQIEGTEVIDSSNDAPEQKEGETKEEFTEREKQYYSRIKKLEEENKRLKEKAPIKETQTESTSQLSPKDYLALQQSGITADDFDEVQDFANYRKVSIAEALNSPTLKTILNERKEERATAQATATKSGRGKKPMEGTDYLNKAETSGEVPTDDKAMQELILAKQRRRAGK